MPASSLLKPVPIASWRNCWQAQDASRPALNRFWIVLAAAGLGDADEEFKRDVAHFLLDEARVLEGDPPADAKQFCNRLARLMRRGLAAKAN